MIVIMNKFVRQRACVPWTWCDHGAIAPWCDHFKKVNVIGLDVIRSKASTRLKGKVDFSNAVVMETKDPKLTSTSTSGELPITSSTLELEQLGGSMLYGGSDNDMSDQGGYSKTKRRTLHRKAIPGNDIVYGVWPCLLAIEAARRIIHKVHVTPSLHKSERKEVVKMMEMIEDRGLGKLVSEVNRKDLDRISRGRPHQGVSLEASRIYFEDLPAECCQHLHSPPVYLVMDQILDPMNMGAILRTAYYLGVDRIVASRHNCCSLTPVVSKASSGVMEVMPVYATRNMQTYLQKQRDQGWHVIGSTSNISNNMTCSIITDVRNFNLCVPTILVIGSEGIGLSQDIEDMCTQLLTITPGRLLHYGIDSLNVSVAAGILLQSVLSRNIQETGRTPNGVMDVEP